MALTDTKIRSLKAKEKPYKTSDSKGLYLETFPNGSKLWRVKFRFAGKEKRLALGAYPEISLANARELRDEARALIQSGKDPSFERKREKVAAKISAADSFDRIAEEYLAKIELDGRAGATMNKARWLHSLLTAAIGSLPVGKIEPQMILAALRKVEAKGNYESARRARSFASRVFRYAVITGRAKHDPAAVLQGSLIVPKVRHHSAILEPDKLGELLRAIDGYTGSPVTVLALKIAPHVFVRPGELRQANWGEFDLKEAVWHIPEGRMKARRAHSVPLSRQVVELLADLRSLTGPSGYAFPAVTTRRRPMSENTLNATFRRMGYGIDEVSAHGFRSSASTLLNESGLWHPDAIERALAHGDSDATRGSYARGQFWEERVRMAQWWSDYLDKLRIGGEVIRMVREG
jgi:integrase